MCGGEGTRRCARRHAGGTPVAHLCGSPCGWCVCVHTCARHCAMCGAAITLWAAAMCNSGHHPVCVLEGGHCVCVVLVGWCMLLRTV